jgi:Flp pilus assembly protein TadG
MWRRSRPRRGCTGRPGAPVRDLESGAAVVEFVLVSVLLVTLFLAVVQLGLALHVRNTLVAAAAEGARYGANGDRDAADAVARTQEVIASSLSPGFVGEVTAGYEDVDGVPTVVVQVRTTLPLVGWLGPSRGLVVQGHALDEG